MTDRALSSQLEQTVEVVYTDGRKETLTLLPMPVARFSKAFAAFRGDAPDFIELVGLYANKNRAWSESLTPDSLMAMMRVLFEGNPDFFAFAEATKKAGNGTLFRFQHTSPT